MKYHIVALPDQQDLKLLNNLRNFIYQHDFRFTNKPLSSDTHLTLAEVLIEDILPITKALRENALRLKSFVIEGSEWILTNENKQANSKFSLPYAWIALKFPPNKVLVKEILSIIDALQVNNNGEYLKIIEEIEQMPIDSEYALGNHINLSNYTREEKALACWFYFNVGLPRQIHIDTIGVRDLEGKLVYTQKLSR